MASLRVLAEQWRNNVTLGTPVIGCNVADAQVVAAVEQAAQMLQLQPVRWMRSQTSFDGPIALTNGYRNPAQLGADRWHCLLGACSTIECARRGELARRCQCGHRYDRRLCRCGWR